MAPLRGAKQSAEHQCVVSYLIITATHKDAIPMSPIQQMHTLRQVEATCLGSQDSQPEAEMAFESRMANSRVWAFGHSMISP